METETQDQPVTVATPETEGGSAATTGSEAAAQKMRDYAKGYQAGIKTTDQTHMNAMRARVCHLQSEITRLRQDIANHPGSYESTVNYLLNTSEIFVKAADVMIGMREERTPQNEKLTDDRTGR